MDLMTQIAALDRFMDSKQEIVNYFKKQYPGKTRNIDNWKHELTSVLTPFTRGKNGQPLKRSSVLRRFQARNTEVRTTTRKSTAKSEPEYAALGKTLPKVPPELGYHIQGPVCINFPSSGCEQREWNHKVTGENKWHLWRTGSLQGLINIYMGDVWKSEEPEATPCTEENDDCQTDLLITALTEDGNRDLPTLDSGE